MHRPDKFLQLSAFMEISGQPCLLRPGHAGRVRCEPGWHLGPDWARQLADYDLWFVWAGRGLMRVGGREIQLVPGVCVWMRPGGHYEAEQDAKDRLGVNFVHFQLLRPGGRLPLSDFQPPFEEMRTRQPDFADTLLRRVIELRAEPAAGKAAAALLGALLMELEREHTTENGRQAPGLDRHHRDLILRTAARIRESPAHAPSVAGLARTAGYSADHFSRVFLKVTGVRPQDYIVNARIERARQLLAESDLTIGMVADALGFQDIFFFSRQFRQRTGQTPTEFRRGLRRA
jgi:AraC-like DNA-binding protein